ncbi:MAG TPA: DUF2231 domain-containing protein [Sulfurovum sp.]
MQLPQITLPQIELPFDIPVLLHPPVVHFAIAIPVLILLLELINLAFRKRAISGVSLFLIFLTLVVSVAAYFTGLVDGKEAFEALSDSAKEDLAEHKTLGIYLMLASFVLLLFKILSMVSVKGIMKGLYLLVLIVFVAGIFEQGEEGGELVYEHGVNVEKVKVLDDKIFDLEEALEETKEETEAAKQESTPAEAEVQPAPSEPEATPVETAPLQTPPASEPETAPVEATPAQTPLETTSVQTPSETQTVEVIKETVTETVKTEVEEEVISGEKYQEMVQPEIATH